MSERENALTMSTTDYNNTLEFSLDYTLVPSLEAADTLDSGSLTELLMKQAQQPRRHGYGISFYFPTTCELLELWNKPLIVLGRRDNDEQNFPNLDLTEHHAIPLGVSRLHAQILFKNGRFCVQDLASKNGSWLNKEPLIPYQPAEIHSQDILRLGQLVIHIGTCYYS